MASQTGYATWNSRIDNLASNIKNVVDHIAHEDKIAASYSSRIADMIKNHPFTALGIAFGLGFMFASVATRVVRDLARFEPN